MILEVETATTQDRKNKPTQYVVKMKDMAAHEQELRSEILEQEQRRRELLQEQEASS